MVQVMRTMSEVTTAETLAHLSKLVKESLDATKSFWESVDEDSKLLSLVDITGTFRIYPTLSARLTVSSSRTGGCRQHNFP
jgi:E3 ubiquitin-protein ligase HUWE1